MTTLERLEAEALGLPLPERTRLIECLLASLDEDDEIAAAWAEEAERRIDALERGETQALPVEDVIAQARARIAGRPA
jgi:putative addiction module component (TIGR02574 family)